VQIIVKCPQCDASLPVAPAGDSVSIACGRCTYTIDLQFTEKMRMDRGVDRCPVCHGSEFYSRKDFDPKLGLAVVIAGALVSGVFYWFGRDLIAYAILASAALIDLIVYQRLGDLTVCYRCHAEFRGRYPRTAGAFDLHTADVLEQEYERRIGRR
jgi:ribosomal protein S27AE